MQTDISDAGLITQVLAGDAEAFASLVNRHREACARYARRMLGNTQDAEDVLQETFLKAYRALERYRERDRFRAWLFRILVNQCRSTARQRTRRDRRFVRDEHADGAVPSGEDGHGLHDALQSALDTLDPMMRESLVLKYGEGMEYDEMSRLTGSSVSALKMRVKRAREAIQPLLEDWFR